MDAFYYRLTEHFPKCNKFIEEYFENPTYENDACTKGVIGAMNLGNKFDIKKCNGALSYASKIEENSKHVSKESLCLYLYYWLYKEFKAHNIFNERNSIYDVLIKIGNSNINICKLNIYHNITDEEIITLNALYDIHKSVHILENYCEHNYNDKLCNVINVLNNKQKVQEITNSCENIKPVIQTIYKSNTTVPIIITITVMILILIFIFIIIKFIPHGSYMDRLIGSTTNKSNNMNTEWNIIKSPGINSFKIDDRRYNILYNRD